jgi:hypothetical protein
MMTLFGMIPLRAAKAERDVKGAERGSIGVRKG